MNQQCGCAFSDLFENDIREIDEREYKSILDKGNSAQYEIHTGWMLKIFPEDNIPENFANINGIAAKVIDLQCNRIPQPVRDDFLPYFWSLKPVQYIRNEVENFVKEHGHYEFAAHIRTWNETDPRWTGREKACNLNNVCKILRKHKDNNIFIASDSKQVIRELADKLGPKLLHYHGKGECCDRNSSSGIQGALIEMLLLSKSDLLFTSMDSTYSEVAWWLGGCEAKVELIPVSFYRRYQIIRNSLKYQFKTREPFFYNFLKKLQKSIMKTAKNE